MHEQSSEHHNAVAAYIKFQTYCNSKTAALLATINIAVEEELEFVHHVLSSCNSLLQSFTCILSSVVCGVLSFLGLLHVIK